MDKQIRAYKTRQNGEASRTKLTWIGALKSFLLRKGQNSYAARKIRTIATRFSGVTEDRSAGLLLGLQTAIILWVSATALIDTYRLSPMKLSHWYRNIISRPRLASRHARHRAFQPLEPRWLMTVDTTGDEVLVNDLVFRTQTTESAAVAVGVSEVNSVVAFSGRGSAESAGVFAKLIDADGTESQFRVNTTIAEGQSDASVAVHTDGSFAIVWSGRGAGDQHGVFLRRFNTDGTPLSAELLVNTTVAGMQYDPTIAMASDGSFAVGWSGQSAEDPTGVYLQRFDSSGEKVGSEVLVNTTTTDKQRGISLVYDSADNLIAGWSSLGQDSSAWGAFGQRFSSDGTRLGDEFAWNTTTAASQLGISLAAGPDGEVVATWQTLEQDGDGWGIAARRLESDGTTFGDELLLNDVTAGDQVDPHLVVADDGTWLATWTTGTDNGAGWEVLARTFESDGTPEVAAFAVNQETSGENSGHQWYSSVAASDDRAMIVWSGQGSGDRSGVYRQDYQVNLINEEQVAPDLADIPDVDGEVDTEVEITVTATDANSRDDLTFQLDTDNSPADATIEQIDNNTAIIRWTPTEDLEGQAVGFRVLVIDDGEPPLGDSEDFVVNVGNIPLAIDLNGSQVNGTGLSAAVEPGTGPNSVLDESFELNGVNRGMVARASVSIDSPDVSEVLAVDVLDTSISANYQDGRLELVGNDTAENYERVLRTLSYEVGSDVGAGSRNLAIEVTDEAETSTPENLEVAIGSTDLVALAQAITDSGAQFFGAGWCEFCSQQKELFEDGGDLLPFIEVTNPDRTLNDVGNANNIEVFPTWIMADGTRLEGLQSLQILAAAAGVAIPVSSTPFVAEIADDDLLVGSPLHIPLNGYDPEGGPITYEVTTNNPGVQAELISGNRSMRVDVAGYGDMVFELFEGRASRATDRVIELAMEDFYDGLTFHRVRNNFVIQGGDPNGDGTGGSDKGDFDDQFSVDLQHNRSGLLSYAKGGDDSNDSQFFITEGESASLRNLDFNHTIFGILVEGEANRDAISNTAVEEAPSGELSSPVVDVVMNDVEIFTDNENAVVMLKADEGVSGPVEVTVRATNSAGNTFERTFTVNVADDPFNGRPFLADIGPVVTTQNQPVMVQLFSTDVEDDPVVYEAFRQGDVPYTFDITDEGLLTVTPPDDFTGEMEIGVIVRREVPTDTTDFDRQIITITVQEP